MGCSWVSPRCPSLPRVKWWDTAKGCGRILSLCCFGISAVPRRRLRCSPNPFARSLGAVSEVAAAGVIGTGTHNTGIKHGILPTQVRPWGWFRCRDIDRCLWGSSLLWGWSA